MTTEKKSERRGLGRGLSALMADLTPTIDGEGAPAPRPERYLPIERIIPNPHQPRKRFLDEHLEELRQSISEKGILQPLIVRPAPGDSETFEIVAGERRWRAAQLAKLHEVPVVVRSYSDQEALEIALIENIQRADLDAVEEATAYRLLMERFGHTQEKLAAVLGKSRSHIANTTRLLSLPDPVLDLVRSGSLSAGHARALVTATDAISLAQKVIREGLNVRDTERLAKRVEDQPHAKTTGKARSGSGHDVDPDTLALERDLSANLGMPVSIRHEAAGEGGTISVRYMSLEQLDMVCGILSAVRRD